MTERNRLNRRHRAALVQLLESPGHELARGALKATIGHHATNTITSLEEHGYLRWQPGRGTYALTETGIEVAAHVAAHPLKLQRGTRALPHLSRARRMLDELTAECAGAAGEKRLAEISRELTSAIAILQEHRKSAIA